MFLTKQQLRKYRDEGYLKYTSLLSARELELLKERYIRVYEQFRSDGKLHNVAVSTDTSGTKAQSPPENLQIHYMCHYDDMILAFLYSRKLLDAIENFIGPNIRLFFEQGFWKPPLHGAPTNWHQDNGYFKLEDSSKGVGCWIALDDATKDNGCMWVVPGSHRQTYGHYRDLTTDHLVRTDVPAEQAVPVELEAGGALFFEFGTLHQTKANTTNTHRRALAIHFAASGALSTDPTWLAREKKFIPLLRGRGSSDGLEEFGVAHVGRWEKEALQSIS
jgi:phytanoyl-CoA hydroxylase